MPALSRQEEYAIQKRRQEKIEKDFVYKRIPKPAPPRKISTPYTDYEKYVIWLID